MGRNFFENIWEQHVIEKIDDENYLMAIDRCYIHDLSGPGVFRMVQNSGLPVYDPSRICGIPDHTLSAKPGRTIQDSFVSKMLMPPFCSACKEYGITLFDLGDERQGIVHVVGPEQGLSLPGMTIVCGDSHTCTHGAMGALAWGVGSTELYHVLTTQTLMVKKPRTMEVRLEGTLPDDVDAMDVILYVISRLGTDFAIGHAVEYTGSVIRNMDMEDRLTVCNLSVEFGSEYGFISPDEKTIEYIRERSGTPEGEKLEKLIDYCREIASTPDSTYDKSITIDVTGITRQVSWGVSPMHTISIDGVIPSEADANTESERQGYSEACRYMGLEPGQRLRGVKIDKVFIGACSNGRLSNIRRVAELVKGKKVAGHVDAWVVPGSCQVKKEAEALGLDRILKDAGFVWGEPGCSLCSGSNGEKLEPGQRSVSTTNRNFIGRQGPGARTHLAGPATAALSALKGEIC